MGEHNRSLSNTKFYQVYAIGVATLHMMIETVTFGLIVKAPWILIPNNLKHG